MDALAFPTTTKLIEIPALVEYHGLLSWSEVQATRPVSSAGVCSMRYSISMLECACVRKGITMKATSKLCILIPLVVFAVSCAHSPKLYVDTKSMDQARSEYVQNHPAGKYNKIIMEGQIAKGMNFDEVTAAWGVPNVRREVEGTNFEHWIYAEKDEDTGLWGIFNLAFREGSLVYWETNEGISMSEGEQPDLTKIPTLSPESIDTTSDLAPIKKGRQK